MRRVVSILALLAAPALAQQTTKLVMLKYADPAVVEKLLRVYGISLQYDRDTKAIALSGGQQNVDAAAEAIKQLDVPSAAQKDLELTAYLVVAGNDETMAGNPVPQDLASVTAQLKNAFPFKVYKVMDVLAVRTRPGVPAHAGGALSSSNVPRMSYIDFNSAFAGPDGDIHINNLNAGLKLPVKEGEKWSYTDLGVHTNVDVKPGQKVVVGRSSLEGPNQALFVILMAQTM